MTTERQLAANRANALRSTGPSTEAGKAIAKMNAMSHGLRAESPVVCGEDLDDWNAFREGVLADLAPVGTLEADLAERVAVLSWRLRRVVAFETGATEAVVNQAVKKALDGDTSDAPAFGVFHTTSYRGYTTVQRDLAQAQVEAAAHKAAHDLLGQLPGLPKNHPLDGALAFDLLEQASAELPASRPESEPQTWQELLRRPFDLDDEDDEDEEADRFADGVILQAIGVPYEWLNDPGGWPGWTAGIVRAGVEMLAKGEKLDGAFLTEQTLRTTEVSAISHAKRVAKLEAELATYDPAEIAARARKRGLLLHDPTLTRVMRYESHIAKQLTTTLHTLERLRAARSGNTPTSPFVLDVTVNG